MILSDLQIKLTWHFCSQIQQYIHGDYSGWAMNVQFLYLLSWHLFWFANHRPTLCWLEDYMTNFQQAKRNLSFFSAWNGRKVISTEDLASGLYFQLNIENSAQSQHNPSHSDFFMLDVASFMALTEWRRTRELLMSAGLCSACYLPSGNNRKHCWHAVQFYLFFTTQSVSKLHESHLLRLRWEAGWSREWRGGICAQIFCVKCTSLWCPVWVLIPGGSSTCCFIWCICIMFQKDMHPLEIPWKSWG